MDRIMENYRKTYDALQPQINSDIEKYRKGSFKIKVQSPDGRPVKATVTAQQKGHKFDFGTNALMLGSMGDREQEYRDAVTNMFNLVTTTFCWGIMETAPGVYRFEEGSEEIFRRPPSDRILKFAEEKGLKAKGQPLFCDRWCPEWSSKDADTLREQWLGYIKAVAERYDGRYSMFDAVNESFCSDRTPDMPWLKDGSFNYVKWVLKNAGEIFSKDCLLERNETTHVNYGRFAERYYNENKQLLEEGIRLDSIGFQFHYFSGKSCIDEHLCGEANLDEIYRVYQKMSTLNVPMYISEITIPTVFDRLTVQQGEDIQAEILEKLYRMWFSIPNMQGIIYWNLKDGLAWLNEGDCKGCLIDEYMRKKKSYYAIEHLIKREWNTCVTLETDQNGYIDFSGFYGNYDITVDSGQHSPLKLTADFDENNKTVTVAKAFELDSSLNCFG